MIIQHHTLPIVQGFPNNIKGVGEIPLQERGIRNFARGRFLYWVVEA